jgi:replicative DNA helicase
MDKLNDQDQAILNSLVDPDKTGVDPKYPFDEEFLRMVLGTLLCNRYFICQGVNLIKPMYFRSEIHQVICKTLFTYFEEYKQQPSKIFLRELIDEFLKKRYQNQEDTFRAIRLIYQTEINLIYDYYIKGGNSSIMMMVDSPEAILDKITSFAKTQAIKIAFAKSVDLIRRNPEDDETFDKIDLLYKEARLVNRNIDLGLNYFETLEERYARIQENIEKAETFTSGFRAIDDGLMGGGLVRGEMGAWMGAAGTGKSLALTWASACNVEKGKKVLYISTEMDPDRIATRFDAQLTHIGHHQLILKKEEVWLALRNTVSEYEDKRRLIIKQFPSGSADMSTIKAYYSQITSLGFRPDLVIFDYPGDMKDNSNLAGWDSRFRLLREIRGFGVEEKHCTLIAVHPNRSISDLGLEEFMDEKNQGDSFKQFQIFDAFWTLNQTPAENKANVGRGFVAKARNGKSKYSFKIRYHFEDQTLRLEEIPHQAYMGYMTKAQDADADHTETVIDKVSVGKKKFEPSDGERIG